MTAGFLLLATAFFLVGLYIFAQLSPWPMVLMRRLKEDRIAVRMNEALQPSVPFGILAKRNLQYNADDSDALLDVYFPSAAKETKQLLPIVVWVHGGSWTTGSKDHIANYLKILASKGFTAIGVDYGLAPSHLYPTPIKNLNISLDFIQRNSGDLHADPRRFFLAGDSAGAQIAAQLANVISSPSYAKDVGIVPSIERAQLKGVVFHCGVYEARLANYGRRGVLWAYFGTKDFITDPRLSQFSVARHVTPNFPPMFISTGNDDALAPQSYLFAESVANQGVYVDRLFFSQDYMPTVRHEFQFFLDTEAGRLALERSVEFMNERLIKTSDHGL
jgi:acetyl esterase